MANRTQYRTKIELGRRWLDCLMRVNPFLEPKFKRLLNFRQGITRNADINPMLAIFMKYRLITKEHLLRFGLKVIKPKENNL